MHRTRFTRARKPVPRELLPPLGRDSHLVPTRAEIPSCGTCKLNRFETEILTTRKNLMSSMVVPGKWIDRAARHRSVDKMIQHLNSPVSKTYGRRERKRSAALARPIGRRNVGCNDLFDVKPLFSNTIP